MTPFLFRQAAYLCRVRWYVFGVTAALIALGVKLGITPHLVQTYIIMVLSGVFLNIISCVAYRRAQTKNTGFLSSSSPLLRWWTYFHTLTDLILIISSIHFTSGTQSPALYLLIVYIAGMALTYGEIVPVFIFTGISAGLFSGLLMLYAKGTLTPAPVFHYAAPVNHLVYRKSLLMNMVALDSLLFIVAGLILIQTKQLRLLWENAAQESVFLDQLNVLSHESLRHEDLKKLVRELSERLRHILHADVVYTVLWEEKAGRLMPLVTHGVHTKGFGNQAFSPEEQKVFQNGCYRLIEPTKKHRQINWVDLKTTRLPEPMNWFFAPYEALLILPINFPGDNTLLGTIVLGYHRRPSREKALNIRARKAIDTIAPLLARAIAHHQTTQHLSLLQELANDVTSLTRSLQSHSLAINTTQSAKRLFNAVGSILLPYPSPPNTAVLRRWYATGLPQEYAKKLGESSEFYQPFLTLEKHFHQVPDVTEQDCSLSPDLKSATLEAGIRSLAFFLVPSPRNPVGVLGLFWDKPHLLSPREIATGQLFAASAGASLYNAYLYQLLRKEAHTDALTRLPNRRALNAALASELRRAQRYHHPFSVVMLDLNNFKAVNDQFGHQRGDLVLQRLASLLQQNLRETDFVGRFGGDEFLIILPETNKHSAQRIMNAVYHAIVNHQFEFLPADFRLQMAFGIAAYPDDGKEVAILVDTADLRLYHHKATK